MPELTEPRSGHLERIQACMGRAAAALHLRRVRAAAETLRACARRAFETREEAAVSLQACARREEAEAHRGSLLSAQHEKAAFQKQCEEEKGCIALLESSASSGCITALQSSLSQAEALGLYHSDAAIQARQALSALARNQTTVKGATMQLENALEQALFACTDTATPCSDIALLCGCGHGLLRGQSRQNVSGGRQGENGYLVSEAHERCKKAGMGAAHVQRVCLPIFKRVVREAQDRSLSALDLTRIRRSILSSMHGGHANDAGVEREFHDELLRPKGVAPKLFYQTRRRSKHLLRLENLVYLAEQVLDIGIVVNSVSGSAVDVCLTEARETLQDLHMEVCSLYLVSSVELYEARQKERSLTRQRQERQREAQGDTSPMVPATKSSLDLEGDGGDWNLAVWPLIKAFAMRRQLLQDNDNVHNSQKREQTHGMHAGGDRARQIPFGAASDDDEAAIQKIHSQWPPARKKPSRHFDAADGLSYQLTYSEEQRQRTCRKGEGLLYLRRQDSKLTAVEVAFVVANTWEQEQHITLSSISSALQYLGDRPLIGHEVRRAQSRLDTLETRACAHHRQGLRSRWWTGICLCLSVMCVCVCVCVCVCACARCPFYLCVSLPPSAC